MSTEQTEQADPAGRTTALPVAEVIAIVREWVDLHARHLPGFAGAYLWAGITALPPEAPFPLYRDVDVVVVLPEVPQHDTEEVFYRGVMLEVIYHDLKAHGDAEAVLANPSHGPNMAATQILADPTGILAPLQREVAAEYGRRRWVQARCEAEKVSADKHLAAMRGASTPPERQDSVWAFLGALSGLLAVAQLKRPTTRRTLTLLRELLEEQGRLDLHEAALAVMGSAHMSRADVQALLDWSVIAFDRSVEVYRTPTPYGFTIRPHLRPYLSEATQEMIDEGNHREAMYWIAALAGESYLVLQNDAPDAEKPAFAAQQQAMLTEMGYTPAESWAERVGAAERLAQEIYGIADDLAALHRNKRTPMVKLDLHYVDPRLVDLYDIENTRGPDTDFYVSLAADLDARAIIDLGCGTGLLTRELATEGRGVTGVDPSAAMLVVARRYPGAERVQWVEGDSSAMGTPGADLVIMTGNVAQVFLNDARWDATLRDIHAALRPGGHLAFESRNPDDRAWERWNREATFARLDTPHGPMETWLELVSVDEDGGRVRFEGHNVFADTGEVVVASSELRFRSREELTSSLTRAGFTVEHVYGGWDRGPLTATSRVMVFVARRD